MNVAKAECHRQQRDFDKMKKLINCVVDRALQLRDGLGLSEEALQVEPVHVPLFPVSREDLAELRWRKVHASAYNLVLAQVCRVDIRSYEDSM